MMTTISFYKSDSFDKRKSLSNESNDRESKSADFAAFLSVPVPVQSANMSVKTVKSESSAEPKIEIQSKQNCSEKGNRTELTSSQKNEEQKSDSMQTGNDTISETKSLQLKPINENQSEVKSSNEISHQDSKANKDFGLQITGNQPNQTEYESTKSLSDNDLLAQIQLVNSETNQFPSQFSEKYFSSDIPKLFNMVSNIIKADNFESSNMDNLFQLNSDSDFSEKQKTIEQVMSNLFNDSEPNLNQFDSPKDTKDFKILENSSTQIFDNLLTTITKEQKTIENVPQNNLNAKIFEQIEPQLLQLAAINQRGNEKKILKMRLNPAELGMVEITLEKDVSGKINARFHTENEKTRQILNDSIVQLRNSLENSGWQVGDLEISYGLFSSNEGERRENQPQKFGITENQTLPDTNPNENSRIKDEENRLVSLRA